MAITIRSLISNTQLPPGGVTIHTTHMAGEKSVKEKGRSKPSLSVRIPQRLYRASLTLPKRGDTNREWRWRRAALVAVQYAAEQHTIKILKQALELAAKEGRITLQHVDFEAAARLVRA